MYNAANAGHIGCSLSCAEILTFLKFSEMAPDDLLVLSKGHAAAALYSMLAEAGDLTEEDIATFYRDGTKLAAHPPPKGIPQIPFATGSLGHGLSLGVGLAMGAKLLKKTQRTFVVTSDGELNEGSIWEAAMFATQHQLTNLVWLIDRNRIQGFGRTEDVMQLEPLAAKLSAFGWLASEVNGHDFESLHSGLETLALGPASSKPRVLVCNTIKGHSVTRLQDTVDCHYLPMRNNDYEEAVRDVTTHARQLLGRHQHAS